MWPRGRGAASTKLRRRLRREELAVKAAAATAK
jgi:hypothetical protein